jgi:putative oxidoreductase
MTRARAGTWALSALLALLFVVTGSSKLAAIPPSPENFARWGLSPTFMLVIGAVEVLGGLGLLFPRFAPLAALVLIGTMLGALRTGIVFGEMLHVILPAVLLVALATLVYLRRDSLARLLGRRT